MITTFKNFDKFRKKLPHAKVVMTSGGFDPIHPGHISLFKESKKLGILVVVVNGDSFLRAKKGRGFMPLADRLAIIDSIKWVDFVIPFEVNRDTTVNKALKLLKPDIFTKGGDRYDEDTIPEWDTCQKLGIKIKTGVGSNKQWSSSWYLDNWTRG